MTDWRLTGRAAVLAAVLAIASGITAHRSDGAHGPALLVLVLAGAITVGGLAARGWWWLGALVGAGATIGRLAGAEAPWAHSTIGRRSLELFGSEWVGLLAPIVVALAGAGLGASLQRLAGFGGGDE
jgi:hypothetical protein